ncbi:CRTAC1 family protein [Opitutaceae bacterium EW11]|nr:CRTAC1 family protein [Opitutaceae bacterium EW11]
MTDPRAIASPAPRSAPGPSPTTPGLSPLVPVLAPLVVAAIVIGAVLSRFSTVIAPPRLAPVVRFSDATAESGLHFVQQSGAPGEESPTTLGSGVAVVDFDRDGAPDLFFVNGAPWPWMEAGTGGGCALYRNDGHGHFSDVTEAAGLGGLRLQGMGVAVGDFDGDSWPDLFVTGVGENHLLRNRHDGTFADVTEQAGLSGDGQDWCTGALWLDLDGDGRLDLVVCRYARWPREVDLDVAFKIAGVGRSYGAPAGFVSASPLVYRNLGGGRFADWTDAAGLRNLSPDTHLPRLATLGVAAVDGNGDGLPDLLFVYHTGEPTLFLNLGGGRFREWVAPGDRREGSAAGLLGLGAAAVPRALPGSELLGVLRLAETAPGSGAAGMARLPARLGVALLDYDLDGRLDAFSGGGRAEPELNRFDLGRRFDGAPALYWNQGETWTAVLPPADSAWAAAARIRGLATADFDGDGDEDVVCTQNGGPARYYRNEQRTGAAWLKIRLVGTRSAANGWGARIEVQTPRHKLSRLALPEMGYLSQSDSVLTFGLGEDARVRRVVVLWPSGLRQEVVPDGVNRMVSITEPAPGNP